MHPIDIGRAAGGPRELEVRTEIASRATAPRSFNHFFTGRHLYPSPASS